MEHLYDTHFHLDLQKDRTATIRKIEENQIYTIAVTNLPDLYKKETAEIKSKHIRIALGFHPDGVAVEVNGTLALTMNVDATRLEGLDVGVVARSSIHR